MEEAPKRKTVGQIVYENAQKTDNYQVSAMELALSQEQDYVEKLKMAVENGKKRFNGDFYIEVTTKKEKILHKVYRNFFTTRKSPPTPFFEQTAYHYNRNDDAISFLWTVPDKDSCILYLRNWKQVPASEQDLLKNIVLYADGTLLRYCQELNGELPETSKTEIIDERHHVTRTIVEPT